MRSKQAPVDSKQTTATEAEAPRMPSDQLGQSASLSVCLSVPHGREGPHLPSSGAKLRARAQKHRQTSPLNSSIEDF